MNQDQQELTLEESIKEVMQTLPPVIRSYLAEGKYTAIAKDLMTRYGLRVDQSGVLERETMLLLMGIENPDQFIQALADEAKLDKKVIDGIVQDVNTQIFIPLQAEEMKVGGMKKETPPVSVPPVGVPQVSPSATTQPASHFHLENKIPLRPAPTSTASPVASSPFKPIGGMARPIMIATPKPTSEKLLEDHEEPHIEFGKKTVPALVPSRTAPPPQNLPGAIQPRIIPAGARPSFIVAPRIESPVQPLVSIPQGSAQLKPIVPTAPITPAVSPTPSKPYATDPYREPIE